MRRDISLAGWTNGHPFRNHVKRARRGSQARGRWDIRLFVLSYTVFLVCFSYRFLL